MAEIPRWLIDNYTSGVNRISEECRKGLEAELSNVDLSGDVAMVRDEVIAIMQRWCGGATDLASVLSAEFYDVLREIEVGERLGAQATSMRVPEATEGAVRAFVDDLVNGKTDKFKNELLDRLDYETKKATAQTIYENGGRDPKKPRFARVPSGSETCDFCIMLASRGFVYRTAESAGEGGHYHANCDCRIVPGWDGKTKVEGYDPDELYLQWKNGKQDSKEHAGDDTYEDIVYPNSVGADTYRDEVRIPRKVTGLSRDSFTQIARGSRITGRRKIAGAGTNKPIHSELDSLKEEYPEVDRHDWEKWAGNGVVEDLGIERRAHLHWYWSEETGRVRMKVDHFLR